MGKTALVTGAGRGIGRAIALRLAEEGARVAVGARKESDGAAVVAEIRKAGGSASAVLLDVVDAASVATGVERAARPDRRVDILVNNAGMGDPMPAEVEPLELWNQIVEINQTAVFHLSQLCGRSMLEQGSGVVVNVASVLGLVASGQIPQASYTATKGAVVQLTRELAVQWARRGVRVNAIAPGWFQSEMTQEMFDDDSGHSFIRRNTPMGRGGEMSELDGALLYLASDASSYTTGSILVVDGGWTAR